MFNKVLAVAFVIAAFLWFWDIVELIIGTYEFNPWTVGISAFCTGWWLIEGAFKLLNEE